MDETPAAPRFSVILTASPSVMPHRRSRDWTVTNLHRSVAAVLVRRRHTTHRRIDRWRRGGAVRSAGRARVVLAASPAQAYSRISDGIALHLVDGHLGSVALDELDETAALARWNLDIGDLTKSLEERAQFILSDVAREASHEDSGIVGICELIHWLRLLLLLLLLTTVEWLHGWLSHRWIAHGTAATATRHTHIHAATHRSTFVLGSRSRNAHRSIAAVDALHLTKSTLLVALVGEADKAVAARHAGERIGHDLGRLAGWETALEERNQDILVDFGTEIANEDGVLGTAVIASIGKAATRSPVELERAARVRHGLTAELQGLGRSLRRGEVDEAISSITTTMSSETCEVEGWHCQNLPRKLVADHLDTDLLAHLEPKVAHEVLVDPGLKLTHPSSNVSSRSIRAPDKMTELTKEWSFPQLLDHSGAMHSHPGSVRTSAVGRMGRVPGLAHFHPAEEELSLELPPAAHLEIVRILGKTC